MDTTKANGTETDGANAEVQALRARVAELEAELVEVQARANAAIGEWQERTYWLERWHLDLNRLMQRRGAAEFRAVLKALRSVAWALKRAKRRYLGS
jgi:hypothetical protein